MKIYKFTLVFLFTILLSGCEDVINVDLNTAAPKLVIDASIQWRKGTLGNEQKVKLTTTTGFYDTVIPTVSGAVVFITNSDNTTFSFIETPNTGEYFCTDFIPEINETYVLTVVLNGQTYHATETLKSVSELTTITQNDEGGFTGTEIEIKSFFNDPGDADNYYLFQFKSSHAAIPVFDVFEDKFIQGNESFGLYINEDIASGDNLDITVYGISKRYFDYMRKIITVAGGSSGGPFSTPPATVRGNIINSTNSNNFALGYFNLSETDFRNYVIQ